MIFWTEKSAEREEGIRGVLNGKTKSFRWIPHLSRGTRKGQIGSANTFRVAIKRSASAWPSINGRRPERYARLKRSVSLGGGEDTKAKKANEKRQAAELPAGAL